MRPVERISDANMQPYYDTLRRTHEQRAKQVSDKSLLSTSPDEIKRQIEEFEKLNRRIHIVV